MHSLPSSADVVIIGAGFAGAATAHALAHHGVGDIVLLEAEVVPGFHGSGRNAAMARRVIADPIMAALATRSVALIGALAEVSKRRLLHPSGGLLLGNAGDIAKLMAAADATPGLAADVQRLSSDAAIARVPALRGARFDGAIATSMCGVADIHALLTSYLDGARARGAQLFLKTRVTAVDTDGGEVCGVSTARGRIATRRVVNAAGFGVNEVARLAGAPTLPFEPVRRHLFVTAPTKLVAKDAPFVWDVSRGYYFRPEGDGLLMCACDSTPWPPADPPTDPAAREGLALTFEREVPGLRDACPTRGWAGIRVLTPDGRFVLGPDPAVRGLVWAAGLGGHGMTTSAGVGELVAHAVLDGALPAPFADAFAPGRFTRG